ncbi:MAG: hypothetical protein ACRDRU_02205 [Pseudonocardiaceae bacterium]
MTDQPRPRYPVQVSVPGTRTDDGTACTLLAIREAGGTWMIHTDPRGAVRITEDEAAGLATAILHLVSPGAARAARAAARPQGE